MQQQPEKKITNKKHFFGAARQFDRPLKTRARSPSEVTPVRPAPLGSISTNRPTNDTHRPSTDKQNPELIYGRRVRARQKKKMFAFEITVQAADERVPIRNIKIENWH